MQQNPFQPFNIGTDNNPLLSSMESLRKAWASMPNNPLAPMPPLQMQSIEDLDKRIVELQAVENWLALNLSMLRNTIQALEIQRSTLNTFQAFTQMQWPSGTAGDAEAQSKQDQEAQKEQKGQKSQEAQSDQEVPEGKGGSEADQEKSGYEAFTGLDDQAIMQAGQAWWDLMQQQFQTLVQTTQSSAQAAQSAAEQFHSEHSPRASGDSTFGKKAAPTTSDSGTQRTAQAAAKNATKKSSSAKSTGAKKASKAAKGAKKSAQKSTPKRAKKST